MISVSNLLFEFKVFHSKKYFILYCLILIKPFRCLKFFWFELELDERKCFYWELFNLILSRRYKKRRKYTFWRADFKVYEKTLCFEIGWTDIKECWTDGSNWGLLGFEQNEATFLLNLWVGKASAKFIKWHKKLKSKFQQYK